MSLQKPDPHSALGRLRTWMQVNRPNDPERLDHAEGFSKSVDDAFEKVHRAVDLEFRSIHLPDPYGLPYADCEFRCLACDHPGLRILEEEGDRVCCIGCQQPMGTKPDLIRLILLVSLFEIALGEPERFALPGQRPVPKGYRPDRALEESTKAWNREMDRVFAELRRSKRDQQSP